jgi:hypothetical protein
MNEIIIGSAAAIIGAISGFFINLKRTNSDVQSNLQEGYATALEQLSEMTLKWQIAESEIAEMREEVAKLKEAIISLTSVLTKYKDNYGDI